MKTNEQFLQDFNKKGNQTLEILEKYKGCTTPILIKCKKCGSTFYQAPHELLKKCGCPYCSNRKVKKGINSFADFHPELIKFFLDKNAPYLYSCGSKQKAKLECPVCKNQYNIPYYILNKTGFNCNFCNSMSYPNKFLRAFLLSIPNIEQLVFEKCYKIDDKNIRYDASFYYLDKYYIVEIHGNQHYIDCSLNNYNVENQQIQDNLKEEFAKKLNASFIVIEAKKSQFQYIKNNIEKTELFNIFNLKNYNWEQLFNILNDYSLLKEICLDYEQNLLRTDELSQKYKLDRHQIVAFLKDGKGLGLCPSYTIGKNRLGMRVEAYDANGHLLGSFPSLKICAEKLNEKYHLNCLPNSISHVLSGAQKSHRNLYFKEAKMYE